MKITINFESEEWNETSVASTVLEAEANLETTARHYMRAVENAPIVLPDEEKDEDEHEGVAACRAGKP